MTNQTTNTERLKYHMVVIDVIDTGLELSRSFQPLFDALQKEGGEKIRPRIEYVRHFIVNEVTKLYTKALKEVPEALADMTDAYISKEVVMNAYSDVYEYSVVCRVTINEKEPAIIHVEAALSFDEIDD